MVTSADDLGEDLLAALLVVDGSLWQQQTVFVTVVCLMSSGVTWSASSIIPMN